MGSGQYGSELRIVEAGRDSAVERHLVHEGEEGLLDVGHVAIAVHVLAVEIGDDGEDGRELEKGAIALVGLSHQILGGAEAGIGAERVDAAADDDGGIEAAGAEHGGDHRCCGRFAMHAGDGDAVFEAHELGEHFGALNDGNLAGSASTTSGLVGATAELVTTTVAPATLAALWPS